MLRGNKYFLHKHSHPCALSSWLFSLPILAYLPDVPPLTGRTLTLPAAAQLHKQRAPRLLRVPRCSERCCHEHLCVCVCAKQLSQNALASSQGLCTWIFDCYCPAARVPALPSAGGRDGHGDLAAFLLRGQNEGGQPARPAPLPSLHLLAKTLTQPVIERTGKREAGREISKLNWAPCRQPGLHSWQGGSCPSSWQSGPKFQDWATCSLTLAKWVSLLGPGFLLL